MKRILSLFLFLALALSFTGCSVLAEEKALADAKKLIEAGQYAQAIDLLRSIERYNEINALLDEATRLQAAADLERRMTGADFLFGEWICVDDFGSTLTFSSDGICQLDQGSTVRSGDFAYADNTVTSELDTFRVTTANGITWLTAAEGKRFVRPADYETVGPRTVEITAENWQEYFELRQHRFLTFDEMDQVSSVGFGYALCLREAHLPRLFDSPEAVNLSFRLEYTSLFRYVTDPAGDYKLGPISHYSRTGKENSAAAVTDYRHGGETGPLPGSVCALFGTTLPLDSRYFPVYEDAAVTEVHGSIILYP